MSDSCEGAVDAHCHLDFKQFGKDREEVIQRARDAGVLQMINSGVDLASNKRTLDLVSKHDFIFATLGLSPNTLDGCSDEDLRKVLDQIRDNAAQAVGIGEAGLDYYRCQDKAGKERQIKIFRQVIELASSLDLPLVIHSRDAESQALDMVKGLSKVVFHCYGGSLPTMKEAVDRGYYISLATNLCFSSRHQILARNLSLDHLLIETDSPYLSPRRGERNEPLYVLDSARLISKIKGIEASEVIRITGENTRRIYNLRRLPH